jgi:hypothetical protein
MNFLKNQNTNYNKTTDPIPVSPANKSYTLVGNLNFPAPNPGSIVIRQEHLKGYSSNLLNPGE